MTGFLARCGGVAVAECRTSLRNRRALVMTLLFVVVAGLVMYGTISAFAAVEREVVNLLRLPPADNPGAVTMTLWKSRMFARVIEHLVGDSLIFADVRTLHPILLAYAFFIFQIAPLLTLVVSASRIADDLRSGAARYWLVRVTRTEWSLGKFLGEAMMLAVAMAVGALAATAVAAWRLPGTDGLRLLPGLLEWTARAWMYAFAWLGLFCGVSHVARSGGKATALSILAMIVIGVGSIALTHFAPETGPLSALSHLDALLPIEACSTLWRRSPAVLFGGVVHLATLAFLYLSLGAAVFRGRDV